MGTSLFTSYALLMHADGVGERDIYFNGHVLVILVDLTMLSID
jgi:hypothetical protein